MEKSTFQDAGVEEAYQGYLSAYAQNPSNPNQHTMPAAIEFLDKVARYYLNKHDAEFIKIVESDRFER